MIKTFLRFNIIHCCNQNRYKNIIKYICYSINNNTHNQGMNGDADKVNDLTCNG